MPSSRESRKSHNERVAREKALRTHVYISGLSGQHTLETGLAYYYRGHYIYTYPAGTLIEPIPYSTRKGIMIQGIVSDSAPEYDSDAKDLVAEDSISALSVSIAGLNVTKEESEESQPIETAEAVEALTTASTPPSYLSSAPTAEVAKSSSRALSPLTRTPEGTEELHAPLSSLIALRNVAPDGFTPRHGLSFLASSAPGSRLASRAASPSGLRPTSSHIGLVRLGSIRGHTHPYSPRYTKSRADSPAEDTLSRSASSAGYLYGLGDHALSAEDLQRPEGVEGSMVLGGGGARVAPCAIHGEECDGVATERVWKTEEMRRGGGFVEEVAMVDAGGRVMVDWAGLLEEAREGGGQ